MILRTPNQERMAQLLVAEQQKGRLGLTPSVPRSALIAALLSQGQAPNAFLGSLESLGLDFLEAMRKKRKKKKPQVLTVPQPAPTTLGPERSR